MKISIEKNIFSVGDFFTLLGSFVMGSLVPSKYLIIIIPVFVFISFFTVKIEIKNN